jgi:pimeloyl-ACP methyl ester carboxylesterase
MMEVSPHGKLIDVGGFNLHYTYKSDSLPTVILEAGYAANHLTWELVRHEIATFSSVFAYDRAGMGWSEISSQARTTENIVAELAVLLEKAEIPTPYILVAHSRGGEYARHYAHCYPDKVGGMVLVDSAHEQSNDRYPKEVMNLIEKFVEEDVLLCETRMKLSHEEIIEIVKTHPSLYLGDDSPFSPDIQELFWDRERPHYYEAMLAEHKLRLQRIKSQEPGLEVPNLGDIPLTVLYADPFLPSNLSNEIRTELEQISIAFQHEFVMLSTNSRLQHVPDSRHNIQIDQPQVVIETVRDMVNIVR